MDLKVTLCERGLGLRCVRPLELLESIAVAVSRIAEGVKGDGIGLSGFVL